MLIVSKLHPAVFLVEHAYFFFWNFVCCTFFLLTLGGWVFIDLYYFIVMKSFVILLWMSCQNQTSSCIAWSHTITVLYCLLKCTMHITLWEEPASFAPCLICCTCRFQACFGFGTTEQNSPCSGEEAAETPEVIWGAGPPLTLNFWKTRLVGGNFDRLLVKGRSVRASG